jgi:heme-degrading monooxygenase HmoA
VTTVLIDHRVADYEAWKPEFDRSLEADWTSGIRSYTVLRGQDDPNRVLVVNTMDSREAAEALVNNSALREAMGGAGVDASSVRIEYLDEVASGTR